MQSYDQTRQAYITVVKVVINDNGSSALPDDFASRSKGMMSRVAWLFPVNPGTYTAGETLLVGYTFEGFSGDCDFNGDTTVALGESKTALQQAGSLTTPVIAAPSPQEHRLTASMPDRLPTSRSGTSSNHDK